MIRTPIPRRPDAGVQQHQQGPNCSPPKARGWGELAPSLLPFFWARFLERGREARRSSPRARRKERVPTSPAPERELEAGWGKGAGLTCLVRPSWFTPHPICHPLAHTPSANPNLDYCSLCPRARPESESRSHSFSPNFFLFFQNLSLARQLPPVFSGALRSKPPSPQALGPPGIPAPSRLALESFSGKPPSVPASSVPGGSRRVASGKERRKMEPSRGGGGGGR